MKRTKAKQHTPGSWINDQAFSEPKIFAENEDIDICRCYDADGEGEANARLIAAAPDLLEACKEAILDLQTIGIAGDPESLRVIEVLRVAIAKAEGKQ